MLILFLDKLYILYYNVLVTRSLVFLLNKGVLQLNSEKLQERKEMYLEILENATYRMSSREIAEKVFFSHNQVIRDLKRLGLYEMWKNLSSDDAALKRREDLYKEYYFGVKYKPTCRELGEQIGLSHTQVAKDLKLLKEKYGYLEEQTC